MTHATSRLDAVSKRIAKEQSAIKQRETCIHKAILQYCKFQLRPEVLVAHVANERRTSAKEGAFLKSMGVVPGFPDLIFLCPDGVTCFMEVKIPGGYLSASQRAFHEVLKANKHKAAVVHSLDEAVAVLELWGALKAKVAA